MIVACTAMDAPRRASLYTLNGTGEGCVFRPSQPVFKVLYSSWKVGAMLRVYPRLDAGPGAHQTINESHGGRYEHGGAQWRSGSVPIDAPPTCSDSPLPSQSSQTSVNGSEESVDGASQEMRQYIDPEFLVEPLE